MDKNKHILGEAIRRLPQHHPPVDLWDKIEGALEADQIDQQWRPKIKELPQYEAPAMIWEQIAHELPPEKPSIDRPNIITLWPRLAAAAAILVLLLAGGWWQFSDRENVNVTFSQELIQEESLRQDWDEDDADIESVMQLAANYPLENPADFERLKADLEELNAAKAELLELMKTYGKDPKVIREIGEIERQRSAVIKQVVTLI